jgi:hypothetical protein
VLEPIDGGARAELEVWLENQRSERMTVGWIDARSAEAVPGRSAARRLRTRRERR